MKLRVKQVKLHRSLNAKIVVPFINGFLQFQLQVLMPRTLGNQSITWQKTKRVLQKLVRAVKQF